MANISIIGLGYVGLCTAMGFVVNGHKVIGVDVDEEKIQKLKNKIPPIYEEGLQQLLNDVGERFKATTDYKEILETDATFMCVSTPSNKDCSINTEYLKRASAKLGEMLKDKRNYHLVVVKSTVIPTTTEWQIIPIIEEHSGKKAGKGFGVCVNPEFLREGLALTDVLNPDMIIIGQLDKKSGDLLEEIYHRTDAPKIKTDIKTAEMIKYALNSFLSTKISFINEIGNICKLFGIDTYEVAEAISKDHRIAPEFLRSGLGYGGSCFKKDVDAIICKAKQQAYSPKLLEAVQSTNKKQAEIFMTLARNKVGRFRDKKAAVLGLAFKPGTDDMRESPAIPIINRMLHENARIVAYDPKAEENAKKIFEDAIDYASTPQEALENAEIALVLTDWPEFEDLRFDNMKKKIVIDGRNIIKNREGVDYEGLCW